MEKIEIVNSSIVLCPLGYYFTIFNNDDNIQYCSADEDEYFETYQECIDKVHFYLNNI